MQLSIEELDGDITKIILDGRLDIAGAQSVDLKLNVLAGSKRFLVIDAHKIAFLGSMGLRTNVMMARTIKSRGGKIVIYAPNDDVEKVLISSGVNTILPIEHDYHNAFALLQ